MYSGIEECVGVVVGGPVEMDSRMRVGNEEEVVRDLVRDFTVFVVLESDPTGVVMQYQQTKPVAVSAQGLLVEQSVQSSSMPGTLGA